MILLDGCGDPVDTGSLMNDFRIASPCPTTWESMAGDERVRFCTRCNLNVYNFAGMTGDEVRELMLRTEGRVCARLYRRADGTLWTRRRIRRVAAAAIAALFSISAFASDPTRVPIASSVKLGVVRATTARKGAFTGFVRFLASPLPGVAVVVRNETALVGTAAITDADGAFTFASLDDGVYRVEMTLVGYKRAVIEHLKVKAGELTTADVAMGADLYLVDGPVQGRVETVTAPPPAPAPPRRR